MSSLIRLRYTPEGGSERVWLVDCENPAWDLNTQTYKATGDAWEDFITHVMKKSYLDIAALLWVLRKRDEPRLALDSVRFEYGTDLVIEDPDLDSDVPASDEVEAPKETA
jgi:hypothetical protein